MKKDIVSSPIPWDKIWMNVAINIAKKSKDPEVKVGAVVVSPDNTCVTTGFNGFPRGVKDTSERWDNENKADLVIHAEQNAILNAKTNVNGWTVYVTLFPCIGCTMTLIQSGVKRVVYLNPIKEKSKWNKMDMSNQLLKEAGVKIEKFQAKPISRSKPLSIRYQKKTWFSSFKSMWMNLWRGGIS